MRHTWAAAVFAALGLGLAASPSRAVPPIGDPALLNIGLVCRWDAACMTAQQKAMGRALACVRKARPAPWKIQLCNRNARRGYQRVDWTGFDHCIRNKRLGLPQRRQSGGRR